LGQTADQLTASLARVRRARQLLCEASERLTRTRQEVEKDERIERVRRAGARLQVANQHLAQTRQQLEDNQRQTAADPATDD
jgi:hypothetical protein